MSNLRYSRRHRANRSDNRWRSILFALYSTLLSGVACQNDYLDETNNVWSSDGSAELPQNFPPSPATRLTSLDVICGKEYMTVRAEFNAPFNGIVFSKGTYGQSKCVYVKPRSALTHTVFNVRYDECGTKPDLQGKYFENTIVIQYGTDIIEALDEAKRLRCEWFEAYEKPATFRPAIPVADLDIIEMNFQGDEIDCWMSIQEGKGPLSNEINRIVTVGQPLTIVVAINDNKNQFDMKVKSCFAHDGVKAPIYLIDEDGCVLRPKMISPFKKLRNVNGKASLISYAQFLAFKFPDSVDVQIQCTVEVCRHGCTDSCESPDKSPSSPSTSRPRLADNSMEGNIYKSVNVKLPNNNNNNLRPVDFKDQDLFESANNFKEVTYKEPNHNFGEALPVVMDSDDSGSASLEDKDLDESITERNYINDIASFLQLVDTAQPTPIFNHTNPPPLNHSVESHRYPESILPPPQKPFHDQRPTVPFPKNFESRPPPRPHPPRAPPPPPPMPAGPFYQPEPVAQVLNIPLSPLFIPPMRMPTMPNTIKSFLGPKLFNKKQHSLPNLFSSYFGKGRRQPQPSPPQQQQYVPNDNFEIFALPMAQRRRAKRTISDKQGEVGLKRGFQVVTSLDLNFSPTGGDQMPVYEGKPAPIVYGVCFSTSHFFFFISLVLALLVIGIATCVYTIVKIERCKKSAIRY